jgi:hypothetical protein
MKLVKMSLAAAMLMGASAYADVENVKFTGAVKLIYQTSDRDGDVGGTGLFEQGNGSVEDLTPLNPHDGAAFGGDSAGGACLTLGLTADVGAGYKFGYEVQGVSTLGLENNLVASHMWGTDSGVDAAWNATQAYVAKTFGNTTVKIGRQELDTPLAFTEKWNVAKNTFEAAVLVNTDIPNTTLVAAYVGKHNGGGANGLNYGGSARTANLEDATGGSAFVSFGVNPNVTGLGQVHKNAEGAYAVGAIVTPMDNLTAQGWYYNVGAQADAIWLQADMKNIADMVTVGAQYATLSPDAAALDDSTIYALKVAADLAGVNVFAAYSDADEDGVAGFSNVATADKTKIYTGTGSIYMDGIVTAPGASTYKIGASTKAGAVKLAASFADASDAGATGNDISAWDAKVSGNVAGVGLTAIYTSMDNDGALFGTHSIDTVRIIASAKF